MKAQSPRRKISAQVEPEHVVKFQQALLLMQQNALFKELVDAQKKRKKGQAASPVKEAAPKRKQADLAPKNRKERRKELRKLQKKDKRAELKKQRLL